MKYKFNHFNFNIVDTTKSVTFYKEVLNLEISKQKKHDNFILTFLSDNESNFTLELTELFDHKQPYDLGECEFHLAMQVDDYDASYNLHKNMGIICYENKDMGIYFIEDPDGYWIEIIPTK